MCGVTLSLLKSCFCDLIFLFSIGINSCADAIYLMVHPFASFAILAFQISVSLFLGSLFFLICLICLFLYYYHTVFIYCIIRFLHWLFVILIGIEVLTLWEEITSLHCRDFWTMTLAYFSVQIFFFTAFNNIL